MKIKIYLEPSEDGGYTAIVPSLPGCISEGDTDDLLKVKGIGPKKLEKIRAYVVVGKE